MVQLQMQIALGKGVDEQGRKNGEVVVRLLSDETTSSAETELGNEFHNLFEAVIRSVLEQSGAVKVAELDISGVDGEVDDGE